MLMEHFDLLGGLAVRSAGKTGGISLLAHDVCSAERPVKQNGHPATPKAPPSEVCDAPGAPRDGAGGASDAAGLGRAEPVVDPGRGANGARVRDVVGVHALLLGSTPTLPML